MNQRFLYWITSFDLEILLSKFLRWSLMIFISKNFWTIVFVFIVFFHNFLAAVSSGPPQVSPVYLGIEMIQPGKSFLKFDLIKQGVQELWSSFANNDVIVFHAYPRSITRSFMRWFFSLRVYGRLPSSLLLFFYLTFLIIGSHIVFISILGLLSRSL